MQEWAFLVGGVGVESGEEKKCKKERGRYVTRRGERGGKGLRIWPFYNFFYLLVVWLSFPLFFLMG